MSATMASHSWSARAIRSAQLSPRQKLLVGQPHGEAFVPEPDGNPAGQGGIALRMTEKHFHDDDIRLQWPGFRNCFGIAALPAAPSRPSFTVSSVCN
jgi:hypothetical protein